jgi:hypothetical protein
MDGVLVETVPRRGSYDIVASKVVQASDLQTPTVFACELQIPEAHYHVTKRLVYYPGKRQNSSAIRRPFSGPSDTKQFAEQVVFAMYLPSSAYGVVVILNVVSAA